jgi:hypothetical protein
MPLRRRLAEEPGAHLKVLLLDALNHMAAAHNNAEESKA